MPGTTAFSGAHPFRPQCLLDAFGNPDGDLLDYVLPLVEGVDRGQCPRCREPLPEPPVWPAGSRITRCRCVPICGPCGDHEVIPDAWRADRLGIDVEDVGWLVEPEERDQERAAFYEQHRPRIGTLAADGVLVTEDGVGPVQHRPHPGGWAEFGYDDSADVAERGR